MTSFVPLLPRQGLPQPDPHLTQTLRGAGTGRPAPLTSALGPQTWESPGARLHSSQITTQASSGGQGGTLASEAHSGLGGRGPRIGRFASRSPARWER